nr:hypothetical protein [uncultured Bacteroides sp.]
MADLVTRILLDNKNFNDNISKSKQQVKDLDGITSTISTSIKGLAGMFGLAMGAAEVFNRTIDATQGTADAFARVTEQASTGVDTFFNALSRGDFSNFLSGLQNSINKAGKLADVLDELDSKKLFNDIEINNLSTKKQIYADKAKDKTLSDAERNKYNNLAQQTDVKISARKKDLANANNGAYYGGIRATIAKGGYTGEISDEMIDYLFTESNRDTRAKQAEQYKKNMAKYQREKNKHVTYTEGRNGSQIAHYDKEYYNIDAQQKEYSSKSFAKLNYTIENTNEKDIEKYLQYRQTANQQLLDISSSTLELHNTSAKINGSWKTNNKVGKSGKNSKVDEVVNTGSLDEVNKQLAEARKKYNSAATDELRQQLFKVVKDLEDKTIQLNFQAQYGEIKDVKQQNINGVLGEKTQGKELPKKLSTNFKNNNNNTIDEKNVQTNEEYLQSLIGISQIMGNITQQTNDSAAAWVSWGGNMLSAIAAVIPQLSALIAVKQVDNAVSKEGTIAAGAKSAAETPVVGWILALSAVAALTASMLSIPKFATGGVVGGSSYQGDKILARLNSGEMVLNRTQQGNLYNLMSNNNNSNNTLNGNVKFEIDGRKLVGVLNNYNKQQSRI